MCRVLATLSLLFLIASSLAGQSLGDVARANREKKKEKTESAAKHIVTNDDIPSSPEADIEAPKQEEKKAPAPGKRSAEEWKSRILAQKKVVATLEAQIGKLNKSIYFVNANEYYNGVQHNQYQAKKQQRVAQMQLQLEEERKHLAEMQEAARQAGMGSSIYDP
jgi:hypothetical protein